MASRDRTSELRSQTTVYLSNESLQRADSFLVKVGTLDQVCDDIEQNIQKIKGLHEESILCVSNDQLRGVMS
jgi:hypothetical protein